MSLADPFAMAGLTDPPFRNRPRFRSRPRVRIAGLLALFLIGILLGECLVRVGGLAPTRRPIYSGDLVQTSADQELGVENHPNSQAVASFRDHAGRVVREVVHRVNSAGWRGPEVALERVPGRMRIACVGDSLLFGLGVDDEGTFPRALERALAAASPRGGVEVLNFGVVGYETLEKARQIETVLPAYRSDLVVMQVSIWGDVRGPQRMARLVANNWITRWLRPDNEGWLGDLRKLSLVVDAIATSFFNQAFQGRWGQANPKAIAVEGPGWETLRAGVLLARDHARDQGAGFLLVLFPKLELQGGRLVSTSLGLALSEFTLEHGIDFLDLHATLRGVSLESLRIHPQDDHYTASAHELAAAAAAEHLLGRGPLRRLQGTEADLGPRSGR